MKTFTKAPLKIFICSALAITFFVVMLCYYNASNVAVPIENIQSSINSLLDKSIKSFNETYNEEAKQINVDLNNNKYAKGEITNWFQKDFVTSWRMQKKLDTTSIKGFKSNNDKAFTSIYSTISSTKNNQLLCCLIIPLIFALFLFLAAFTNLLRDLVNEPKLRQEVQEPNCYPPFSLSRTQLGVWVTIIASFYIHAYLWKGCSFLNATINSSTLLLMGISAGTFATGAIIDSIESQEGIPRIQNQLASGNFFKDILSDGQGVSIHRFQNVIWTIVAIVVYFYCYNNGIVKDCLPDLDPTLIALTGISSATYLTFKSRENIFSDVKIQLVFDQTDAEKKEIIKTKNWTQIEVKLQDASGKQFIANKDANSNFDFIASNLTTGVYSINVSAKGDDTDFVGTYNGVINSTNVQPIVITINKKA